MCLNMEAEGERRKRRRERQKGEEGRWKGEGRGRGWEGKEWGELSGHMFRSEPTLAFGIFFFDSDEDQPGKPKFPPLKPPIHFTHTYRPPTAPRPC